MEVSLTVQLNVVKNFLFGLTGSQLEPLQRGGRGNEMRKNDQRGDHIKKFREDHYPSQKAFADALGLGQSVVSAWERGDNVPSSEAWVKIASVAPSPDNLWFLRQAGLDREIIKAAAKALGESILLRPKEGETVQIPRFRETEAGREEAGPPIPLPAEFIPNPLSTVCLLVDSKVTGITRSDKALFILDESESHTTNLSPFWNRVVFARYRPESQTQRDPHAPPGIYMGRIGFVQPTEPNAEMIFWAVGRLSLWAQNRWDSPWLWRVLNTTLAGSFAESTLTTPGRLRIRAYPLFGQRPGNGH